MKILITGANGLLGQKLLDAYSKEASVNVLATSRGSCRLPGMADHISYQSLEITDEQEVKSVVQRFAPDVIIHTAAMTNVAQCAE